MCFYCLTFLWVYQHLSSRRLFIKYHLPRSFASLPLFSPLNCSLKEGFTFMFFHVQPLGQPFPALWGWHLNLHNNLYSSSLPPSLVRSALARDGSRSWLGSIGHRGSFWLLLPEGLLPPLLPNLATQSQYMPFLLFSISVMHLFWMPMVHINIQKWLCYFRCISRQM